MTSLENTDFDSHFTLEIFYDNMAWQHTSVDML